LVPGEDRVHHHGNASQDIAHGPGHHAIRHGVEPQRARAEPVANQLVIGVADDQRENRE